MDHYSLLQLKCRRYVVVAADTPDGAIAAARLVRDLDYKCADLEAENAKLTATIAGQKAAIEDLQATIERLTKRLADVSRDRDHQRETADRLRAEKIEATPYAVVSATPVGAVRVYKGNRAVFHADGPTHFVVEVP